MRMQVRKWGNSASVRIPASIMAATALSIDQEVEMHERDGCIVIEPVCAPSYDLDTLIASITPDNVPDEIDFGKSVGAERW